MKQAKVILSKPLVDRLVAGQSVTIRLPDVEITVTPQRSPLDEALSGIFNRLFGRF